MKIYQYDCIVIGTGASGYNAAIRLKQFGKHVAMVTEQHNWGTSRNTGSDKQTYYKLGLGGDCPDSVSKMAENLFAGGCVDGDNALCEAALSVRSFLHLCELGVPFPTNRYGEYIGYKTDHDPYARATSAGPLTSKFMTEVLEKEGQRLEIPVYSGYLAIEILKHADTVCGLVCMELESGEPVAFHCGDIVMCTGGPAGIYADSVYPYCHTGTTSLALLAGAKAQNLTEWQYGLASVQPRWNVSGTYMQVLPRFVSVDDQGVEREFLSEHFPDPYDALSAVFLKGYQWPFDSGKVKTGSSVIDLLVYRESVLKKRKVYLDFTKNPFGLGDIDYKKLSPEAYTYLSKAGAAFGTPIQRLAKMNMPAIELYKSKGVDISEDYLQIALCAQHNNGGIAVDMWWQSSVKGLFCAGECAGTHGVTRPGGSALNAGQVGSLRAAQYIAKNGNSLIDKAVFHKELGRALETLTDTNTALSGGGCPPEEEIRRAQRQMSDVAAAIRKADAMVDYLESIYKKLATLSQTVSVTTGDRLYLYYKLRDILVCQAAVITAMADYASVVGSTRGSSLCYDAKGTSPAGMEETFRFTEDNGASYGNIQETQFDGNRFACSWRPVRPLPQKEDFFETIWATYRENQNIY